MNRVQLSPEYFPDSAKSKALGLGEVYVGTPDLDPEVVGNQKQVTLQQEDGSLVAVSQPIDLGAGGVPLYNGSPVTMLVSGNYSLKVLDSQGNQEYYVPSIAYTLPVDVDKLSNYTDLADAVSNIGATDTELWLDANDSSSTTVPANIAVRPIAGYTQSGTVTWDCPVIGNPIFQWLSGANHDFGSEITVGFAEWWGVDGTADQVEINYALSACEIVQLLPKTYNLSGAILAVSNGKLLGTGEATILNQGADGNCVTISNVTDFEVAQMKMDGQSAARTNSVPIRLGGTSSATTKNIRLKDLWMHDGDVYAISMLAGSGETISDVTIEDIRIDSGCSSNGISISGYSTGGGSASTIKDVSIDRVNITSVTGGGISVNGRLITYSGNVVDSIFIGEFYSDATGNFGISFNEGASNCHLKDFSINNATGNGVSMESCFGFSVRDGEIRSAGGRGIRIFNTGSGADEQNATREGKIDNIIIDGSGSYGIGIRGGLTNTNQATDISITHCTIIDSVDHGIWVNRARRLRISDNLICGSGGAGNGKAGIRKENVSIQSDIKIYNNSIIGGIGGVALGDTIPSTQDQDYGIWDVNGQTGSSAYIRGNYIKDHNVNNVVIGSAAHPFVFGEVVNIQLGSVAAGSNAIFPIYTVPEHVNGAVLLDAILTNGNATITPDAVNYTTFKLRREANIVSDVDTNTAGDNTTFAALTPVSMDGIDDFASVQQIVAPLETVDIFKQDTGAGQALTYMLLQLRYIQH